MYTSTLAILFASIGLVLASDCLVQVNGCNRAVNGCGRVLTAVSTKDMVVAVVCCSWHCDFKCRYADANELVCIFNMQAISGISKSTW